MAGITNLLGLGRDALQAQAYGLNIAGQNVTNANTPGYVKRTAELETRVAGSVTYGGVYAKGLQRSVDRFLDAKNYEAAGFDAQAKSRDTALTRIENIFNDSAGTGLSSSIQAMFSAFGALGATPSDMTARTTVLESARVVAQRIRDSSDQISSVRRDLLDQAQGVTTQINDLGSQLAKLNQQILQVQSTGGDAADLCDQRDSVVSKMSGYVNLHVFSDSSGQFVVSAGGATLVEGNQSAKLAVSLSATDGSLQVTMDRPGSTGMDVTSQISGGTLGGIREARDVDAVEVSRRLDQFSYDLGTAVNAQHASGYGLDGSTGRNLFQVSGPEGAAATITLDPTIDALGVAAAESSNALPGGGGNAVLLSGLAGQPITAAGSRTAIEAYSDLVGDVGQRKSSSAQNVELRSAILSQTKTMRDGTSGVSLDEEMVTLSQFQRAYQAGAKLIQTADELMAGLMQNL